MKLPSVLKLRSPIAVSIFVLEIAWFTQAYKLSLVSAAHGFDDFVQLIFISQTGFWLLVAWLWNDWFQRRGVWFSEVLLVILPGFSAIFMAIEREPSWAALNGILAFIFLSVILHRLFRPLGKFLHDRDTSLADKVSSEPSSEAITHPKAITHPIKKSIVLLVLILLFLWAVWLRTDGRIPIWLLVISPISCLCYVWIDHVARSKRQSDLRSENAAATIPTNQGGRA